MEEITVLDADVFGIDLGTTFCVAGLWRNGRVEIIANREGNDKIPSCVSYTKDQVLVGEAAKQQLASNPENTIYDMKRLIGKNLDDENVKNDMKYWTFKVTNNENRPVNVQYGDQPMPENVSTEVLKKMKETVARVAGKTITKVVITVPSFFNQLQRQATKEAALAARLEVLELITEPAAAAYAYGFGRQKFTDDNLLVTDEKPSYLLIFDLGGGTFDVVVVKVNAGQFKVVSIGRDTHLGGRDFDNLLMDHCATTIQEVHKEECFINLQRRQKLLAEVIKAKENLSTDNSTEICLDSIVNGIDPKLVITRKEFDKISFKLIQKIKDLTEQVLSDVSMVPNDIHEVLLIGGSSRIPAVRALLVKMFPEKLLKNINAKTKKPYLNDILLEPVAYGAALRAAQLSTVTNKEVPNINNSIPVPP